MNTATIKQVYEIASHAYNSQGEKAYKVLLSNGRTCWLVGFGSDYRPATKSETAELTDFVQVPECDDGSEEWEDANDMIGTVVEI